ncbi:MAG TPA: YqzL family protein [Clostridiaceae bacterium]|nr:YqzL family protein [Clostridiaceae bacterium]
MLKDFLWKAFECTGSIDSYIFYKEIEEKDRALKERKIAEEEAATGSS